jgi:hypothetical protein
MSFVPDYAGLVLGPLYDPEEGGDIFLRNSEKFFELHPEDHTLVAIVIIVPVRNLKLYFRRSTFRDSFARKCLFLWPTISETYLLIISQLYT